jgi:hypothetical protein
MMNNKSLNKLLKKNPFSIVNSRKKKKKIIFASIATQVNDVEK